MDAKRRARERRLTALFLLQALALSIAAFVPFGFDHPSRLGLDFGHFLVLAAAYLAALVYGLGLAVTLRRGKLIVGQLALPAAFVALDAAGVIVV